MWPKVLAEEVLEWERIVTAWIPAVLWRGCRPSDSFLQAVQRRIGFQC